MIKAIFYKEWIKMRCFYPLSALFLFGATAYALLRVQRVITCLLYTSPSPRDTR